MPTKTALLVYLFQLSTSSQAECTSVNTHLKPRCHPTQRKNRHHFHPCVASVSCVVALDGHQA